MTAEACNSLASTSMQLGVRQSSISACSSMCVCVLTYTYTTVCIHATLCVCYSLINLPPSMPPSMPFTPTPSMCTCVPHVGSALPSFARKIFLRAERQCQWQQWKMHFFKDSTWKKGPFDAHNNEVETRMHTNICACV